MIIYITNKYRIGDKIRLSKQDLKSSLYHLLDEVGTITEIRKSYINSTGLVMFKDDLKNDEYNQQTDTYYDKRFNDLYKPNCYWYSISFPDKKWGTYNILTDERGIKCRARVRTTAS
jgi:hypothetical protein